MSYSPAGPHTLRVLIVANGQTVHDFDGLAEEFFIDLTNEVRELPGDGPFVRRELTGGKTLTVEYMPAKDSVSAPEERPARAPSINRKPGWLG